MIGGTADGLLSPLEAGSPTSFYVDMPSVNGVSGMRLFDPDPAARRVMFLAGVFTDATGPGETAPARLDFSADSTSVPGGRAFTDLAPAIDQSFYIGDGLAGEGSGPQQIFRIPDGATHLSLGFLDGSRFIHGPDFYGNNAGKFIVSAMVVSPTEAVLTEPKVQHLPSGTWRSRVDGLTLTIEADGGFAIIPPNGTRPPLHGQWTEADGIVEFRNHADSLVCPSLPGRYRWEQDFVGAIQFELLDDHCESRMSHMVAAFDPVAREA